MIPEFSSATPGRLTTTLNLAWPNGAALYIAWTDDNATPATPDTAFQIDNFSAIATPSAHIPVSITADPQNTTVEELDPVSFTVGVSGNPTPTVQWYTNDVAIPGATSTAYSISSTPLHFNGLRAVIVELDIILERRIGMGDHFVNHDRAQS